jgi:membrane associated rhomboid family serine protease
MGLYDRDYYRDEPRGMVLGGDMSVTMSLILVNAVVFLVDAFAFERPAGVDPNSVGFPEYLGLSSGLIERPYDFWQALTYGFVHDARSVRHVLFNMIALWIFGRDVETIYGKRLYLQLYLSLIILSGLVWFTINAFQGANATLIGASGAVTGIMVLYVLHYPTRTFLIWGVFPLPVWAIASLQLLQDIQGVLTRDGAGNVAYTAHLAGAAFAFLFYKTGWQLGSLLPKRFSLGRLRPKPRLRVHSEEDEEEDLARRLDRILEKINREGQDSLTRDERRTLERASRRYQQKRR